MPNRTFDDSTLFRAMVKDYLVSARSPSLDGAVEFVNAKCEEQNIIPPTPSTVSKLLKKNGFKPTRWAWGRA